VEITEFNISTVKRLSRAIRKTARQTLPAGMFAIFNKAYCTIDTIAVKLKKHLSFSSRRATRMHSRVYPLRLPLEADPAQGWNPQTLFTGSTRKVSQLGCHASALMPGCCPHPPHTHPEEELLLLLAGELDLLLPDGQDLQKTARQHILPQQLLYYPLGFHHTIKTGSSEPANYIMLKWRRKRAAHARAICHGPYDLRARASDTQVQEGMRRRLVFEGTTAYLKKLHCHVTTLSPQAGYAAHADHYDVIIVVLEGEVETLERRASAHSVIFYAAGEPHGLRNPSRTQDAHYVVFELHG
jgi:quercetin dioxygenase-like cupin family protein